MTGDWPSFEPRRVTPARLFSLVDIGESGRTTFGQSIRLCMYADNGPDGQTQQNTAKRGDRGIAVFQYIARNIHYNGNFEATSPGQSLSQFQNTGGAARPAFPASS